MTDKVKILIYSDCYLYGGSEKILKNIIKNETILQTAQIAVVYRKHKLYQENLNKDYSKAEQDRFFYPLSILANENIFYTIDQKNRRIKKVLKIPFRLFRKIGIYFAFNVISQISAIKKIKPDIIHINNGGYPAAASCNAMVLSAKLCGIKGIIYQVNNISETQNGNRSIMLDKFINHNVDLFITASSEAKELISNRRNFSLDKIKQVPNTIIEETITRTRTDIISELGFAPTDFILCNVALLSKRKGQRYLIDAISLIRTRHPLVFKEIKLIIVGDGEEEYNLKNQIEELNLGDRICMLGYRADSINYIDACDVFILPSIENEDMPLVILSAMSKGKTIISTDFAGIREELDNGTSGILISRNVNTIVSDLSDAIINLFENKTRHYGQAAKTRFRCFYSYTSYGESISSIYKNLYKF